MAKISAEKILEIQRVYSETGIYSQTAKIVGCSPSTVKKYCTGEYTIQQTTKPIKIFDKTFPKVEDIAFSFREKEFLSTYTLQEEEEMKGLWEEL